ncbi:MAG: hypothetical protein K2K82_00155 [Muribaculaceae bacterium]|nr:hypothetical protein [Muribaculaceae bacterium]
MEESIEWHNFAAMMRCYIAIVMLVVALSTYAEPAHQKNIKLKEVTVNARSREVLHTLGYVREFSELTAGSDTVFLFREKWVDFMLPSISVKRFKGWNLPRILSSKSYYHFTNAEGLDSVSDRFSHHFSWADWMQIPGRIKLPQNVYNGNGTDTIHGRYRPTEIWRRADDRIDLTVNVIADTTSRRWVPALNSFFQRGLDFERFDVRYLLKDISGDCLTPHNLDAMTVTIESNGRGRDLYKFNRPQVAYYVRTYAEMFVADREYISVRDAQKIEQNPFTESELQRLVPADVSDLDPAIISLIARVNAIDTLAVKTNLPVDQNIGSLDLIPLTRKQKIVRRLRGMLGLPLKKYDKSKKVF